MGIGGFLAIFVPALVGASLAYLILRWCVGRTTEDSLFDGCCWLAEQAGYGLDLDENCRASLRERNVRLFHWSGINAMALTTIIFIFLMVHMFVGMGKQVTVLGDRMLLLWPSLSAATGSLAVITFYQIAQRMARAYVVIARMETGNADVILLRPVTGDEDFDVWRVCSDLLDDDCGYLSDDDAKGIVPDSICMAVDLGGCRYIQAVEI